MQLANIKDVKRDPEATGRVLGLAYPDRLGRRRAGSPKYLLTSGKTATLPRRSVLDKHECLAIGLVDGAGADVRILLAAPIALEDIERIYGDRITTEQEVRWDAATSSVVARTLRTAGRLILEERLLEEDSPLITDTFLEGIRQLGLRALPWDRDSRSLVERAEWLRTHGFTDPTWPNCSDDVLTSTMRMWLRDFVGGMRKKEHLTRLSLKQVFSAMFTHEQLRQLDKLAPTHLRVPSGSKIQISYDSPDQPVLAVKLQELFGLTETPTVAGGKAPVTIHLLSPAARPLAVTQDLPSFWKNTYPDIRKQMRARYPKHPWPEDPMTAVPTRRTNRRR